MNYVFQAFKWECRFRDVFSFFTPNIRYNCEPVGDYIKKINCVLLTITVIVVSETAYSGNINSSEYTPDIETEYKQEFDQLNKQLQGRKPDDGVFQKAQKRLRGESLNVHGLLLPEDRDPLDVVLRRSAALLTTLRKQSGKSELSGLEKALKLLHAKASKLFKMLEKGHNDLKLPAEDLRRITLWLDCNSNFYGTYHDTKKQAQGELVHVILQ